MIDPFNSPPLVIISNCSPGAVHVIKEVMKSFPVRRIIRPVWQCPPLPLLKRVQTIAKAPGLFLLEALNERHRAATSARLSGRIHGILNSSIEDLPRELIIDIPTYEINSSTVSELLRKEAPDLLLVCGAPILRKGIYSVPRLGAVNLHLGIAPAYRGEHTILWPLRKKDYGQIGVTVHRITAKVDAGPVLARGYPQIEEGDDEVSLLVKSYRMGAELIGEVLKLGAAHALPTGKYFNIDEGTLIRYRDLNILNSFKDDRTKVVLRNHPPLSARIERMYDRLDR